MSKSSAAPAGERRKKVWLRLGIRSIVATTLLVLVFRIVLPDGSQLSSISEAWNVPPQQAWLCFGGALVTIGFGIALNALRFRGILRAAGLPARWGPVAHAYVVSTFLSMVSPGGLLGDAYRVSDTRRNSAGEVPKAIGLVALERALGLCSLGSICLLMLPFVPLKSIGTSVTTWVVAISVFCSVGGALCLSPRFNRVLLVVIRRVFHAFPSFSAASQDIISSLTVLSDRPGPLARAFLLSVLSQVLFVGAIYLLALPLSGSVHWSWFAVLVPVATLISLVPISVGGTGVREYAYVVLFGAAGMDPVSALALSLSNFAVTLAWGCIGILLYSWTRSRQLIAAHRQ